MVNLPLRLRVFLFFCLIAAGSVAIVWTGLWIGFSRLGQPEAASAFVTAAIVAGFGLPGFAVAIWLLFDTHVSKPIEAIAGALRLGSEPQAYNPDARYLGDLAPAAAAMRDRLATTSSDVTGIVDAETQRLRQHRRHLIEILSDIPTATILVNRDHKIILYDGQAADLMAHEAPVRLNSNIFDYFPRRPIEDILRSTEGQGRRQIAVTGHSGRIYSGLVRVFANGTYALLLEPLDADAARPLTYDFDLLERSRSGDLAGAGLRDLAFVVFDTETTGLDPATDSVVQLGAVRVVNGKIVQGEVFDRLANPGRPIPPLATKVHGIGDAEVADAPDFTSVCHTFHGFATDAVLVAHNAPFDMAFLHRDAGSLGVEFDHPVIDTVHLSAIVFGGSAEHTLDAVCERLGVEIPATDRHTALGDALATARALVALLPVLEARGLDTLQKLQDECRRHRRIIENA